MLNYLIPFVLIIIMLNVITNDKLKNLSISEEMKLLEGFDFDKRLLKKIGYSFKDYICTDFEKIEKSQLVNVFSKNGEFFNQGFFEGYCFKRNKGFYIVSLDNEFFKLDENCFTIKTI